MKDEKLTKKGDKIFPVRQDAVTFLGELPSEPDSIPVAPPNGFFWINGGAWFGDSEAYGIADCRVSSGGETLDFVITLADALSLRSLLDQSIEAMREEGDDERHLSTHS